MYNKSFIIPPGETIEELMHNRHITSKNVMTKLNMNRAEFKNLINGKIEIKDDIAEKLSEIFAIPKTFWINLERNYRGELYEQQKVSQT